jgi:undecaprenyl-diphosphatase
MDLTRKIVIGIIMYAVFLLLFVLFLSDIMALDQSLFFAINSLTNIFLDPFFIFITYAGSSAFWILSIILLWLDKRRKVSIYLILAFVIDSLSQIFLKTFFIRPRPYESLSNIKFLNFEIDIGPSFPSGHTQRAFSGATILGSFYNKLRIPMFIIALLVGISRIYIGVHYPLDVFSGAINGILFGLITLNIPVKKIKKKLKKI